MLKSVICGMGPRGLEHAQALQELETVRLEGFFDISAHARRAAERLLTVPGYGHLESLCIEAEPEIVVIATPPENRLSLVRQITQWNSVRAIVVEKPLALSVADARQMSSICRADNIRLFVCHQLRFSPEFVRLKAALESGQLGQLRSLQAFCYGNLFNQGPHMVDLLRWLMGDEHPVRWVTAQACNDLALIGRFRDISSDYTTDSTHPAPLWAHAILGFASDVQATLSSGLLTPPTMPSLGDWLQKRIVVVGTEGTAEAHVASHFKLLTPKTGGWQVERTGMQSYQNATLNFYRAVVETLINQRPSFLKTEDAIRSLEVVLACFASITSGQLVTLPLPEQSDLLTCWQQNKMRRPAGQADLQGGDCSNPIVSIVLPMADHRGLAVKAIESWSDGQRCDPASFELILVIDESLADFEKTFRQMLRPQDKLINQAVSNEMEQYDIGARQATGRYLFFTEPHCIAEPETVAEIIHYFATNDLDGFCARSNPICHNQIAWMESRMYDKGFEQWSQPDDWRKVILRGFGVRREAYFEVGGFNYCYQRFSEWLLAATLRTKGYRLGYAPGVGVSHLYTTNLRMLDHFIQEFTDGESLYRLENPPESCEPFFGSPPEWYEARSFNSQLARMIVTALLRQLGARRGISAIPEGWRVCLSQFLRLLPLALLGRKLLLIQPHLTVWWAKLRCYLWWFNDEKMFRAFEDYYMGTTTLCRVRFASNVPPTSKSADSARLSYIIAEIRNEETFGFHALERYEGRLFRWTSAVAALRIRLEPHNFLATVQLNNARQFSPDEELSIVLNRTPIQNVIYNSEECTLVFEVPPEALTDTDQWLIFLCRPWRLNNVHLTDERTLGLPLVSVNFVRKGHP